MGKERTDDYQTIRIWARTHHRLKVAAALLNESIVEVLDRLSEQALEEAQQGQHGKEHTLPGLLRK